MPSDTPGADGHRLDWIDIARGIGIVLVVYGHALRGMVAAGLLPADAGVRLQDALIYAFHMPLFFFLSGLFGRQALRAGRRDFLAGRFGAIVYPYVLWSLIQGLLSIAVAGMVNQPATWAALLAVPWSPIGQFWFLYALLLCQLCLLLPGRHALLIASVVAIVVTARFGRGMIVLNAAAHLPFFAAGVVMTGAARRPSSPIAGAARSWRSSAGRPLPSCSGTTAPWTASRWCSAKDAIAFSGLFGALAVGRLLAGRAAWLARLGRASLPIFLAHTIATAAVRVLLGRWQVPLPPEAMLALLTAVGLVVPYGAYRLARRLGWQAWLGFEPPRRRPRAAAPGTPARRAG